MSLKIPYNTYRLVFDQTIDHHSLAKVTRKGNHHKFDLSIFHFINRVFSVISKDILPSPCPPRHSVIFFLKVSLFYS